MRSMIFVASLVAAGTALAYEPVVEREFSDVAANGCRNRDGDFILRGLVSSADEDTLVLSDSGSSRSTISVTLPGRGPFAKVKGVFGRSKHEASDERLNQLRGTRTPVVVTMKCSGRGSPIARSISYENSDGTQSSISF